MQINTGIILAGGTGERLPETGIPKQFFEVAGVPLIGYSLLAFQKCASISAIIIVAPLDWRSRLSDWCVSFSISKFHSFALPGQARQQSIYNGLKACGGILKENDLVVVHDAARPNVTAEDIERSILSCAGYDGATPSINVTDTIYKSADGVTISALLNRDELFAGQTPESYRYGKYMDAHRRLTEDELRNIRGSSEIAFKNGMKIRLYHGRPDNFKVTTLGDLDTFKHIKEV